jgi:LuxR family maltose regulon positive regulatory protein
MQLLSTKTQIPAVRPTLIVRHDLLQQLDGALAAGAGIFLVSAPAGYGKTTLLAHWFTHLRSGQAATAGMDRGIHCGWFALDGGDNDPARFLGYLGAALQQADAGIPLDGQQSWGATLPLLINAVATLADPLFLVLDDYHHISAQSIHDLVAALLEHRPANFHLAIATRTDPPLPLARLRGCGQIAELRQNDLRFSAVEAAQFLDQALEQPLTREHVATLTSRTEGWIAGLQMAALSLQGRPDVAEFIHAFAGSHRHILDYLSEEVYRSQPQEIRRFLVRTSVLERFDAHLCAAVLAPETPDPAAIDAQAAQQILEYLEHANLFVAPLDDNRRWYRYHQLFADLLRLRLTQEQPEVARLLHQRASEWFEQQQYMREAICHALAAQQYDRAAYLMEQAAEASMLRSEVTSLRTWLEALPPATLHDHPLLCVYEAGAMLLAGEAPELVEPMLRDALLREHDAIGGPVAVYLALLATHQGHDVAGQRLAQRALALLPEHSRYFRSFATLLLALNNLNGDDDEAAAAQLREALAIGDHVGNIMNSVLARCHLGGLALLHNHPDEAQRLYTEALALADELIHPEAVRSFPLIGLGILHYERNELVHAQRCLEQGLELNLGWGQIGGLLGRVVLAKVRRALGCPASTEAIAQMIDAITAHGNAPLDVMGRPALLTLAQAALQADDVETADRCARAAGVDPEDLRDALPAPASIMQCQAALLQAQLLAAHGHQRAALRKLAAIQQSAARQGRDLLVLQSLVGQALLHHRSGHEAPAADALAQALGLAAHSGLVRVFVDGGAPMADLLRLALRRNCHVAFVTHLLAAFEPSPAAEGDARSPQRFHPASIAAADPLSGAALSVLSQRELAVLDLVAQGMTNQEIAVRLTVALCTVKTHLNNICRKLDAPNRTAAVTVARHFHLLATP